MFHINLKKKIVLINVRPTKKGIRERERKREIIVGVRRRSTDIQLYFLVLSNPTKNNEDDL